MLDYNVEEVYQYVKNFSLVRGRFTEFEVEDFIERIDESKVPSFDYDSGITRCVIIPNERDYVIKIPFNGQMEYDFEQDDFYFKDFYSGGGINNDDYCALEEALYEDLKETKFRSFFLPIDKVLEINDYPIYVQPKAVCFAHSSVRPYSSNSYEVASETPCSYIPTPWLANCLEDLNGEEDELREFVNFLHKKGLDIDLHQGNIGYRNNRTVIIDYAGFYD